MLTSCQLDALSGARGFLKCENFQRVGAFKFRGAYHAIARLIDSVNQNHIVSMPNPNTHADGLRTSLGELTLPILRRHVAGLFAVGEEEIVQAMQFAHERLKLVIEPSSAVALVPLLRQEPQLVGKRDGAVFTRDNVEWLWPLPRLDGPETVQR